MSTFVSNTVVTATPVELLGGYGQAHSLAQQLGGRRRDLAALKAVCTIYGISRIREDALGGDVRRIWESIKQEIS